MLNTFWGLDFNQRRRKFLEYYLVIFLHWLRVKNKTYCSILIFNTNNIFSSHFCHSETHYLLGLWSTLWAPNKMLNMVSQMPKIGSLFSYYECMDCKCVFFLPSSKKKKSMSVKDAEFCKNIFCLASLALSYDELELVQRWHLRDIWRSNLIMMMKITCGMRNFVKKCFNVAPFFLLPW